MYDSHKRKAGEVAGTNNGGKAEAEWVVRDIRDDDEKDELTYTFTASALRCREVKSSSIAVKNPQIVEMKWEHDAVLWGKDAVLKIKSFEVAEIDQNLVIEFYERQSKVLLKKEEYTIDKDDIDITISANFELDKASQFSSVDEYYVCAIAYIASSQKKFVTRNDLCILTDF